MNFVDLPATETSIVRGLLSARLEYIRDPSPVNETVWLQNLGYYNEYLAWLPS